MPRPVVRLSRARDVPPRRPLSAGGWHYAVVWFALACFGAMSALPARANNLLANGGMEAGAGDKLEGWTVYNWGGSGTIGATREASLQGDRALLVTGISMAKQAAFQKLDLAPCAYRYSGAFALHEATANPDGFAATIHIAIGEIRNITHKLGVGTSDWRRFEFVFRLPAAQSVQLYLFHYGSGNVFFDDVTLVAEPDCNAPERFSVSAETIKPLTYEPPLVPADLVLAGYCGRPDFAARPVCRRISRNSPAAVAASAPPPEPKRMLADFEQLNPFGPLAPRAPKPIDGKGSGLVPAGSYLLARRETGLPEQWTGYDWLRFDVENPTATAQPIAIEIWDDKTTGYWSRVNWYTVAAPGRSTLEVPLQGFVGEKSVIAERRRLDLAKIRTLSFSNTKVALAIDNVRLELEPPLARTFPELIALDATTGTSPEMRGFIPFASGSVYRPDRGWGIIPGSVSTRTEDRRHPDNLNRDWIGFTHGGVQFDLPNGDYVVHLFMEDAGYWEYYPSWNQRRILIQDKEVLDEKRSVDEFFARYFRHASDEDWPGDDIWARYVAPRYKPLQYKATVQNNQLTIRFASDGNPLANSLAGLVIYPAGRSTEGAAFMRELEQSLERQFNAEYRQYLPRPETASLPPANAFGGKAWMYRRSATHDVMPHDRPSAPELVAELTLATAKGHAEPLTVSFYVERDLDLVEARLSLPGFDIDPGMLRHRATRMTGDGSVFRSQPRLLDPLAISVAKPLRLKAGTSRTLWFDLRVRAATPPGTVAGRLELKLADGTAQVVPVTVTVPPWTLPEADIPLGYLGMAPIYPGATYPQVRERRLVEMAFGADLLARAGMNSPSGGIGGIRLIDYFLDRPRIDFKDADVSMQTITRYFSSEVLTYGGLELSGALNSYRPVDTRGSLRREYPAAVKETVEAIAAHGRANQWLPLLYVVGDEPDGNDVEQSIRVADAISKADGKPRTAVFTSVLSASEKRAEMAGRISRLYLNNHSEAAIKHILSKGSECSLYNRMSRYERGVYLFKMRNLGCRGHQMFAFSSVHADPWYGLDGREDEWVAVFAHPDGRLRPSMDFLQFRHAIIDYKHLLAVEQAAKVTSNAAARSAAIAWLAAVEARVRIGSEDMTPWPDDALDTLRREAVGHLLALGYTGPPARAPDRAGGK